MTPSPSPNRPVDFARSVAVDRHPGDDAGFADLFRHTGGWLIDVVEKLVHSTETAEAIAERVFVDFWRQGASTSDSQRDREWLLAAALTRAVQTVRDERTH